MKNINKPKKLLKEYPWKVGDYWVEPIAVTCGRDAVFKVNHVSNILVGIEPIFEERNNNDPAPLSNVYVSTNY